MPFLPSALLIATLGSKAQIVTLTLDALGQQGDLPGEVVVVHTDRTRTETATALERLQADLPLTYPQVAYRSLELADEAGPLRDVTAPHEVEVAFRAIYAEVHAAKLAGRIRSRSWKTKMPACGAPVTTAARGASTA